MRGTDRLFPSAKYDATQIGSKINAVQKEIGLKKKVCVYLSPKRMYGWLLRTRH